VRRRDLDRHDVERGFLAGVPVAELRLILQQGGRPAMILSRQLLVQLVADCAVHSWDPATAIGVDPGLEPPASPLPEGATALERLLHLPGR
jgi:hypothetical protein